MLHFLQPIWMLAAAAMIVPVIIHLWNVKRGKILKVGSIAFLTKSSKKFATSLKITEWLLLVIRCLLIAILALLLSKPQWSEPFRPREEKGWMLIGKIDAAEAYSRFKPLIDSLATAGYELHDFAPGFKKEKLEQLLKDSADIIAATPHASWSLLHQLDQYLPGEFPVYIFTNNLLSSFTGSRPGVSLNLHWNTFTPADSVAEFIEKAYAISADSIRAVVGNSGPSGNIFTYETIPFVGNTNADFKVIHQDGKVMIAHQQSEPQQVDTSTLNVTIFSDNYPNDANYIKAAVNAVQQYNKHFIRLEMPSAIERLPRKQDWLFWLSDRPIPGNIKADNIFNYRSGKIKNVHSWINTNASINGFEEKISLSKITVPSADAIRSEPLWQDGFGDTILSLEESGINTYSLYTHIDPAWNDLAWSNRFPQLIYTLLYPGKENDEAVKHDKRIISSVQLLPAAGTKDPSALKQKVTGKDISSFFLVATFILFCIERFIALRPKKEVTYG